MNEEKIIIQKYLNCHISFTYKDLKFKDDFRTEPKIKKTIYPDGEYIYSITAEERYYGLSHKYIITIFYDLTSIFGLYQNITTDDIGHIGFIDIKEEKNQLNISAKWIEGKKEYKMIITGIKGESLNFSSDLVDTFSKRKEFYNFKLKE